MSPEAREVGGFTLSQKLGSGGFGTVYLGTDTDGRRAAVKLLHHHLADDPKVRELFSRELTAARQVQGFCVAEILAADPEAEVPWIATEYVDGPTLAAAVREHGPHTGSDLQRLAIQSATALSAIHAAGVIHRDLKPDNILLAPEGPRVIDFGVARAVEASGVTSATMVGTAGYMAPEQLEGLRLTSAADVFAWGVVMVFAATGRQAFPGESNMARIARVLTGEPDTDGVPESLLPVVRACLAKLPEDRPAAREVLDALLGGQLPRPADATGPPPLANEPPAQDPSGPPHGAASGPQAPIPDLPSGAQSTMHASPPPPGMPGPSGPQAPVYQAPAAGHAPPPAAGSGPQAPIYAHPTEPGSPPPPDADGPTLAASASSAGNQAAAGLVDALIDPEAVLHRITPDTDESAADEDAAAAAARSVARAEALAALHRFSEALEVCRAAEQLLATFGAAGPPTALPERLALCRGDALLGTGRLSDAELAYQHAESMARRNDIAMVIARCTTRRGRICLLRAELMTADRYYKDALGWAQHSGSPVVGCEALLGRAHGMVQTMRGGKAAALAQEARGLAERSGAHRLLTEALYVESLATWTRNDVHGAEQQSRQAVERAQAMGMVALHSEALSAWAMVALSLNRTAEGKAAAEQAASLAEHQENPRVLADVLFGLGKVYRKTGERQRAAQTLDRALRLAEQVGMRYTYEARWDRLLSRVVPW